MKNEKIREGFYFFSANHDFFVETDQQVKSHKLARKIAEAVSFEVNDYTIETIFRRLQKAHCKNTCFTNSEGKKFAVMKFGEKILQDAEASIKQTEGPQ